MFELEPLRIPLLEKLHLLELLAGLLELLAGRRKLRLEIRGRGGEIIAPLDRGEARMAESF